LPFISEQSADFLSGVIMIDAGRFDTPHASLYFVGATVITALFILNKLTALCIPKGIGLFDSLIYLSIACCIKDNEVKP